MKPIIELKNLSVAYNLGKSNENWALKDISASIEQGEYVVFFGPSGCGKSTLLYAIASLEFPTKGKVIVNSKDLNELSEKQRIIFHRQTVGMIFQAYYLIPTLTVKDNIMLPKIFANHSHAKRDQRAKELMERFGILHLQNRMPAILSGGQQQRVAIARALIQDPPIILADEPVGNLDSENAEIVLDLLNELNRKDKKTIIHVTHNPADITRASRIFYMKDGKLIRKVRGMAVKSGLAGKTKQEISELERLAQAHPYLTDTRLRAKLILSHLLFPLGIEVQQIIEKAIDNFLLKKINQEKLLQILDEPPEKGGVNLYSQKARDLTGKIVKLAQEIEIIEEEGQPILTPPQEKATVLRGYLLDSYKGQTSIEQIQRIEEILLKRVTKQIGKKELERLFDVSLKQGGAGLNRRTAKRFTRELELVLMESN